MTFVSKMSNKIRVELPWEILFQIYCVGEHTARINSNVQIKKEQSIKRRSNSQQLDVLVLIAISSLRTALKPILPFL